MHAIQIHYVCVQSKDKVHLGKIADHVGAACVVFRQYVKQEGVYIVQQRFVVQKHLGKQA
jgi:hypothetical protein